MCNIISTNIGGGYVRIPKITITSYTIKDIVVSEIAKQQRINDLRKKTDILIIDDEDFAPQEFLENNNYRFTNKRDIDNIRDVSEYPIILCDIRGIGKKISNAYEGAFVIQEIKKNYPEKIVLAYTASQYDPSYNSYIQKADDVLQKSLSTESWLENLDKYLYMISDPIFQWKKFRNQLLEKDVSLITVARYEDIFVKSYKKGDFKDFKNLEASVDGDIKNIFSKFISTILVELIKAI